MARCRRRSAEGCSCCLPLGALEEGMRRSRRLGTTRSFAAAVAHDLPRRSSGPRGGPPWRCPPEGPFHLHGLRA
eukprot:3755302-Lingulodinium_polyedra.AAC.1